MTETMEQYTSKTRGDYGSGLTRPTINQDTHFELKGKFLKELHDNTFSGSEHEDANEHIEKVLEIVDLFHIPTITQDQIMLRAFLKWHNGTSSRTRSTKTFDRLAAILAQLNNLGRKIKKVNKKVYAAQFGVPYQPGGQYRAARPGFYQRNNGNSSYPDQRPSLEESLTKFMKSKVLQERGFGSLPNTMETNPQDQVKSISTAKVGFSMIRHIGYGLYAVSGTQYRIVPFLRRLQYFGCDDWREAQDVKILDAYDHALP
ncbi:hypothetical protein Tco_1507571 [Tanacetum coccineum]